MNKKKKSSKNEIQINKIALATAILNLITGLVELVIKLTN